MVSLYEIFKDKYGEYYIYCGEKRRIKRLEKTNKERQQLIDNNFKDNKKEHDKMLEKILIKYNIIYINKKKYIKFS